MHPWCFGYGKWIPLCDCPIKAKDTMCRIERDLLRRGRIDRASFSKADAHECILLGLTIPRTEMHDLFKTGWVTRDARACKWRWAVELSLHRYASMMSREQAPVEIAPAAEWNMAVEEDMQGSDE